MVAGIKVLVFDYDGVLADSFDHNLKTVNRSLEIIGHDRMSVPEDYHHISQMTFAQLGVDLGVPAELISVMEDLTSKSLINSSHEVGLFDELVELLPGLSKLYKLAIISNTVSASIDATLRQNGLRDYFCALYGGDHSGSKADKLHDLSEVLSIDVSSLCMIGDALSDVVAGKDAGSKTAAVCWGYQSGDLLKEAEPDFVFSDPADLGRQLLDSE